MVASLILDAGQRVCCGWFMDGDQEKPLAPCPVQQTVSSIPLVDLQRLDLELRKITSQDSGWKLLKRRKRDKLLSLLVEKMRQSRKPEAFLQSLTRDPSLSTKKDLITKLLSIVSKPSCAPDLPETEALCSKTTPISFYQPLLLPQRPIPRRR